MSAPNGKYSGGVDMGADRDTRAVKPCARRMDVFDTNGASATMWCTEREGHEGACRCPRPEPIASNPLDKGRSRT